MEELKQALILRREYNKMDFDEYSEKVKQYVYDDLSTEDKKSFDKMRNDFEFSGLNNVDFFTMYVELK